MKLASLYLFLIFSLSLSAQQGFEKYNRFNAEKKPHGRFVYYYDKGKGIVHSVGRYRDGVPVGKWLTLHETGATYIITRHYKNRAREKRYYQHGKLEKKGWSRLLLDDPAQIRYFWHGKWKLYDENGKLFRVLLFSEGRVIDVIKNLDPEKEGIIFSGN